MTFISLLTVSLIKSKTLPFQSFRTGKNVIAIATCEGAGNGILSRFLVSVELNNNLSFIAYKEYTTNYWLLVSF